MKEYTHTKMKKVLTTIDSSRFIPAVWQREFIYADTASVPPEYKACLCSSCEDHIDDNHHTGYSFDQEDGEVIAKGFPLNRIISYRNV